MNTKIKFAVIGCGHIGKRHAEMIARKTAIDHIVEIPNYYTELDKIIPYLVLKPKNINNKQSLI